MACGSSWSQESALMESSLGRGEMGSSLQYEDWFSSLQQTRWNLVFSTFWASPLNPPGQSPTDSKQKLEVEGLSILPLLSVWFCGGYESYENLFLCKKYHFVFFFNHLKSFLMPSTFQLEELNPYHCLTLSSTLPDGSWGGWDIPSPPRLGLPGVP